MSLHAQLSPEAQARIAAQRRTSTLTSVIIALLAMTLIGVILMIIALTTSVKNIPDITYVSANSKPDPAPKIKKVNNAMLNKPASPSSMPTAAIAAQTTSPIAIKVPEVPPTKSDFGIDDGDGFGNGGFDSGQGKTGTGIPGIPIESRKRCSLADRMDRLINNGGSKECETAVVNALRWLKKTQNKNGSWTNQKEVGMTGLALLTFLGHCETAGSEEFGDAALSAITYLIDISMKNNGKLATDLKDEHWCYEHAIATYALAEAYTLCVRGFGENISQLEEAVMASGQFLINSQHQGGGWDYAYSEDSARGGDVSIVGWHLQALKACKFTGLDFANMTRCYKKGLDYIERMQASSGAIGYSSPNGIHGDGTTLAAVGGLCFQIWKSLSTRVARKAVKFMDKEMKFGWDTPDADLYGHYYAVQCMINNGGKEWERYNKVFRDEVLNNQDNDGSFKVVGGGNKLNAVGASFAGDGVHGRHYRTCLAALMLESYYRFLPAGQGGN